MQEKIIEELTRYFLENKYIIDGSDFQKDEAIKTKSTIEYLFDNNLTEADIYNVIDEYEKPVKFMHPENLPDCLWDAGEISVRPNNSNAFKIPCNLIKRNRYLFHNELTIWSNEDKHWVEPRILYTYEDLLKYFIRTHNVNTNYLEISRARQDLYYVYSKLNKDMKDLNYIAETIDLFLWLMDQFPMAKTITFFNKLENYQDKLDEFVQRVEDFKYRGFGIIWRADARCT